MLRPMHKQALRDLVRGTIRGKPEAQTLQLGLRTASCKHTQLEVMPAHDFVRGEPNPDMPTRKQQVERRPGPQTQAMPHGEIMQLWAQRILRQQGNHRRPVRIGREAAAGCPAAREYAWRAPWADRHALYSWRCKQVDM